MPKRSKRNASDMLERVASRKKKPSVAGWYDKLSPEDRKYVGLVVNEIRKNPDVSVRGVADCLVEELGVGVSPKNVCIKLKELRDVE